MPPLLPNTITIQARLTLRLPAEGGRSTGIVSGYRPNHVLAYGPAGQMQVAYVGEVVLAAGHMLLPGETADVTVHFSWTPALAAALVPGRRWWLHEGARQVGEAVVL